MPNAAEQVGILAGSPFLDNFVEFRILPLSTCVVFPDQLCVGFLSLLLDSSIPRRLPVLCVPFLPLQGLCLWCDPSFTPYEVSKSEYSSVVQR